MLLKIACLLMRWSFGLAALVCRGDQAKNAELLVLRHENAVLRRHAGRVRYEPTDRAWFTVLTRFIPTTPSPAQVMICCVLWRVWPWMWRWWPTAPAATAAAALNRNRNQSTGLAGISEVMSFSFRVGS
jgi:hypothetical protein